MAEIRTLKLNLLADISDFSKGMRKASGYSKTTAGKIGASMRNASLALAGMAAAAGVAAIKLGVDMVKAAMEDQAAQATLRKSLQKTTHATDAQVAAAEAWIQKMQFAKGFSDTELRQSLAKFTNRTHDVTKSQKLLNIAMDTSRGTGKDLSTVTDAISKAMGGNFGALTRLGVPLDEHTKKTKDVKKALQTLVDLYGGQAATYSDTFAGKVASLKERFNELKESVGTKLIDALGNILTPIQKVIDYLSGDTSSSLTAAAREGYDSMSNGPRSFAQGIIDVKNAIGDFMDVVTNKGPGGNSILNDLAGVLHAIAWAIRKIAWAWSKGKAFFNWWSKTHAGAQHGDIGAGLVPPVINNNGEGYNLSNQVWGANANGGGVGAGRSYLVGERGPELFTPNTAGRITSNGALGGPTIILNGVVDAESARRAIERLIQKSQRRTGTINWNGAIA